MLSFSEASRSNYDGRTATHSRDIFDTQLVGFDVAESKGFFGESDLDRPYFCSFLAQDLLAQLFENGSSKIVASYLPFQGIFLSIREFPYPLCLREGERSDGTYQRPIKLVVKGAGLDCIAFHCLPWRPKSVVDMAKWYLYFF